MLFIHYVHFTISIELELELTKFIITNEKL